MTDEIKDSYHLPRGEDFDFDKEDDSLVQVTHLVPQSVREAAQDNSEHGELSDAVRDAYRIVAFGEEFGGTNRLEQELRKVQSEKKRVRDELDSIESRLEDVERREEQIQERIEESETREERFSKHMEAVEDAIRDGEAVFPGHGKIQEAASMSGRSEEDIIDLLKDRNPELPDAAFQEQRHSDEQWTGTGTELSVETSDE